MTQQIGVIGAGSWGTTLASIAADNAHPTLLWTRREEHRAEMAEKRENASYLPGYRLPDRVEPTNDLERVCRSCRLLVLVVPSHGFREIVREMGKYLEGDHIVVHATKGIEQGTFRRMSELIREETCVRRIGVISGPNLAKEIAARQPAGTLIASNYDEVLQQTQAVFHNPRYFRVYTGRDVVGAEIGGAFKNIVALAAGVVDGLGLGDNTRALLLTRGLHEMARVGATMGANAMTFGGLAGIGDLMATCASPLSRNHQVGFRIAKGERLEDIQAAMRMVAEGVKTTHAVHTYAKWKGLSLAIVEGVYRVLYENEDAKSAVEDLMALPPRQELSGLSWG